MKWAKFPFEKHDDGFNFAHDVFFKSKEFYTDYVTIVVYTSMDVEKYGGEYLTDEEVILYKMDPDMERVQ